MSDMKNRFSEILDAAKHRAEEEIEHEGDVVESPEAAQLPRRGRPPGGKRSDPSFEQVTAYVRKKTYQQIKIALLEEDADRDFSDLVQELLTEWLKHKK